MGVKHNTEQILKHSSLKPVIRSFHLILFLAFLLLFPNATIQAQEVVKSTRIEKIGEKKYYIHSVEAGQTLHSIAKAYALTVNDLVIENPAAIDGIKVGDVLHIPYLKSLKSSYDSTKPKTHKTEPGQTLYSISKLYDVSIDDLKILNPELKDGLKAGQLLKIPAPRDKTGAPNPTPVVSDQPAPIVKNDQTPVVVKKENAPVAEKETPATTEHLVPIVPADTLFSLEKKDKYRVAFFAPFHADAGDNTDPDKYSRDQLAIPSKSELAIQFYQGFRLAMDSLKKTGLGVELFVYDIDDGDSAKLQELLHKPELVSMNLIIGPLSGSCFMTVAKFAHKNNIAIVSPLMQQNKVLLNNPQVSKMIPSVTTQLEGEAAFIARSYKGQNVILVSNSNPKEAPYSAIFSARFSELARVSGGGDTLRQIKASEGFAKFLSSTKVNVLVIPSNSQAYITDLLRALNTLLDKYQIVVFGMQSWSGFSNLDYEYLDKLQLHYAVNSFVSYDDQNTVNFIKNFRILTSTEPATYAFQGYDAGLFYFTALREYGINFQKRITRLKTSGTQSAIDLYQTSPESGCENKAVNLVMIQDFKLVRAK